MGWNHIKVDTIFNAVNIVVKDDFNYFVSGAVGPPGADGIKGQQGEQGDAVRINY